MRDLNIALIQADLAWEDSEKNLEAFDGKIENIDEDVDLIILPEMFNTGFSINPEKIAEDYMGRTYSWMQEKARETNAAIAGSVLTKSNGKYFNRFYWVLPDGSHQFYDKKHLFRLGKEWQVFTAGSEKIIISYKGWKIRPLICYDLRFPVWSKNRLIEGRYEYDLLIYVANWPAIRKYAWKHLLIGRAIENLSYVAGVNRVGRDGNGIQHSGDTMVLDAKGQVLSHARALHEETSIVQLSKEELENFRNQFQFSLDWDDFEVK